MVVVVVVVAKMKSFLCFFICFKLVKNFCIIFFYKLVSLYSIINTFFFLMKFSNFCVRLSTVDSQS